MLVYGEVGCRKALGGFQRTNRTAVQFESGKGDVKNSAAAFVFFEMPKASLHTTKRQYAASIQERKNDNHEDEKVSFISDSWRNGGNDHSDQCIGDPDDVPRCNSGR